MKRIALSAIISICALGPLSLASCSASAVPVASSETASIVETERFDLGDGHVVVFFTGPNGAAGVYERGKTAIHPSVIRGQATPGGDTQFDLARKLHDLRQAHRPKATARGPLTKPASGATASPTRVAPERMSARGKSAASRVKKPGAPKFPSEPVRPLPPRDSDPKVDPVGDSPEGGRQGGDNKGCGSTEGDWIDLFPKDMIDPSSTGAAFWADSCLPLRPYDKHTCASGTIDSGYFVATELRLDAVASGGGDYVGLQYGSPGNINSNELYYLSDGEYLKTEWYAGTYGPGEGLSPQVGGTYRIWADSNIQVAYGYNEAFVQNFVLEEVYPDNTEPPWTKDSQGVAVDWLNQDTGRWFFTNASEPNGNGDLETWSNNRLWAVDIHRNMSEYPNEYEKSVQIPQGWFAMGYWHLGDPGVDHKNHTVLVPVQGKGKPPIVLAYDWNLNQWQGDSWDAVLSESTPSFGSGAWVAVNPVDGLLYTSDYADMDTSLPTNAKVDRYTVSYSPFRVTYHSSFYLDESVRRIQGGSFSPSGRLYLVSDNLSGAAGVYGVSVPPESVRSRVWDGLDSSLACLERHGHVRSYMPIDNSPSWGASQVGKRDYELEGIDMSSLSPSLWGSGAKETHMHVTVFNYNLPLPDADSFFDVDDFIMLNYRATKIDKNLL